MGTPLVFISHNGYDGAVRETVDALMAAMADEYTPLIDREHIAGGTDIPSRVDKMIRLCDAAVVIISRGALDPDKPWVLTEAARLDLRADTDGFQVIPVFLDGLTPDTLRSRWSPVSLANRNAVIGLDPAAAAAKAVRHLEHTKARVSVSKIELAIANALSRVSDSTLARTARAALGGDPLLAPDDVALAVARKLVRAGSDALEQFVQLLGVADRDLALDALELVLPFTWIDHDSAARIPLAMAQDQAMGINSDKAPTARAYVHCATWPAWPVIALDPTLDGEGLERIRREAREHITYIDGGLFGDAEPEADDGARQDMVVLAVACQNFDEEIVEWTEAFLANAVRMGAIFLGGDVDWASVPEPLRERIEYLQPELDRAKEAVGLRKQAQVPELRRSWQPPRGAAIHP